MSDEIFRIDASVIDVETIMTKIEERVQDKKKKGIYDLYNLENLPLLELEQIKTDDDILNYSLRMIQKSSDINISDYQILKDGRGIVAGIEVFIKKLIWKLLKFYTYRLFVQQKEFNYQVVNALNVMHRNYQKKIEELNNRVRILERKIKE